MGTHSLYLEYMPYGDLSRQHGKKKFSPGECAVILQQTLSALEYLHGLRQKITHRDIKPQNILVKCRDENGDPRRLHVKLSDFGLSKDTTLYSRGRGTPLYVPLEVLRDGENAYTEAVDIWSLGVVMLELIDGLPVFTRDERWYTRLVQAVNNLEPNDMTNLLRHMVVIEPDARYTAAACLREATRIVEQLSRGQSVTPTQASHAAASQATAIHRPLEARERELQEKGTALLAREV